MKKFLAVVVGLTLLIGASIPVSAAPNLPDIKGHWAENDINALVEMGAIVGQEDGKFHPNDTITKAEFIKILIKLAEDQSTLFKSTEGNLRLMDNVYLTDVNSNDWYYPYIKVAVNRGVIVNQSYNFNPNKPITRVEMALFASNLLRIDGQPQTNFTDIKSEGYTVDIARATSWNVMDGKTETIFEPKGNATRAEASKVLKRVHNAFIHVSDAARASEIAGLKMEQATVWLDGASDMQRETYDNSMQALKGLGKFASNGARVSPKNIKNLKDIAVGTGKNFATAVAALIGHDRSKEYFDEADRQIGIAQDEWNKAIHAND